MSLSKLSGVVVPLGAFTLGTSLLAWAGRAFHDQIVHTWVTRALTLRSRSQDLVAAHHSLPGLVAMCAFLGLAWGVLVLLCAAFGVWAWRGYP